MLIITNLNNTEEKVHMVREWVSKFGEKTDVVCMPVEKDLLKRQFFFAQLWLQKKIFTFKWEQFSLVEFRWEKFSLAEIRWKKFSLVKIMWEKFSLAELRWEKL